MGGISGAAFGFAMLPELFWVTMLAGMFGGLARVLTRVALEKPISWRQAGSFVILGAIVGVVATPLMGPLIESNFGVRLAIDPVSLTILGSFVAGAGAVAIMGVFITITEPLNRKGGDDD